jgi:tRNA-dihydrouridine synthase B
MGAPGLIGALADALESGADRMIEPVPSQRVQVAREHLEAMLEHYGEYLGLRTARKHLTWYLDPLAKGHPWTAPLRHSIVRDTDPARVLEHLVEIADRIATTESKQISEAA